MTILDAAQNLVKVTPPAADDVATQITLSVADAAKLPAPQFDMIWWNATDYPDPSDDPMFEFVRITIVNTGTGVITFLRAQETSSGGKAASVKNLSSKTYKMACVASAKMFEDIDANLYHAAQIPGAVSGTINGLNVSFTLPWTPKDPASVVLWLNQQPYFHTVHFTLSGASITYLSPPDATFAGTGHYATGH